MKVCNKSLKNFVIRKKPYFTKKRRKNKYKRLSYPKKGGSADKINPKNTYIDLIDVILNKDQNIFNRQERIKYIQDFLFVLFNWNSPVFKDDKPTYLENGLQYIINKMENGTKGKENIIKELEEIDHFSYFIDILFKKLEEYKYIQQGKRSIDPMKLQYSLFPAQIKNMKTVFTRIINNPDHNSVESIKAEKFREFLIKIINSSIDYAPKRIQKQSTILALNSELKKKLVSKDTQGDKNVLSVPPEIAKMIAKEVASYKNQ